ncbi:MAG: hypothetical protein G01um101431_560 [Parcubacteria group bacterium Gr01-1014_31]|nr:MAG: hypothetical protein G01um101431_560 [Parcubacteria group bacterium Gr01-1014_31]
MTDMGKRTLLKIVITLIIFLIGGIAVYQFWWVPKRKAELNLLKTSLENLQKITSLKYQAWSSVNGVVTKTNIWRKTISGEERGRTELLAPNTDELQMIVIGDTLNNEIFYYRPTTNIARRKTIGDDELRDSEGGTASFAREWTLIMESNPSILGKEIIGDREYIVVKTKNGEKEIKQWKSWIWTAYGIPVREMALDRDYRGIETGRDNVEVNVDIPDDVFTLPAGAQVVPFSQEEAVK